MYQFLFLPCKVSTCGFNIVYCLFASPFDCFIPALKTLSRHLWATSTVNIIQQSCCFLSYCPLKVLLCILSAIKQPTGNLYLCTTDKPLLIILSYIMHADISNCAVAMPRKKTKQCWTDNLDQSNLELRPAWPGCRIINGGQKSIWSSWEQFFCRC